MCGFLAAGNLLSVGMPATRKPRSIRSSSQRRPPPTHPTGGAVPRKVLRGLIRQPPVWTASLASLSPPPLVLAVACYRPRPLAQGGFGFVGRSLRRLWWWCWWWWWWCRWWWWWACCRRLWWWCWWCCWWWFSSSQAIKPTPSASHRLRQKKILLWYGSPVFLLGVPFRPARRRVPLPAVARHARSHAAALWLLPFFVAGFLIAALLRSPPRGLAAAGGGGRTRFARSVGWWWWSAAGGGGHSRFARSLINAARYSRR